MQEPTAGCLRIRGRVTAATRARETARFKKAGIPARPRKQETASEKIITKAGMQPYTEIGSRGSTHISRFLLAGAICIERATLVRVPQKPPGLTRINCRLREPGSILESPPYSRPRFKDTLLKETPRYKDTFFPQNMVPRRCTII